MERERTLALERAGDRGPERECDRERWREGESG